VADGGYAAAGFSSPFGSCSIFRAKSRPGRQATADFRAVRQSSLPHRDISLQDPALEPSASSSTDLPNNLSEEVKVLTTHVHAKSRITGTVSERNEARGQQA